MTELKQQTNDSDSSAQSVSSEGDTHSHQGSLRSKLVLSLAAVFLTFLTIDEMVRRQVIEPEFVALENAEAIRDSNRVLAAMNAEVHHLSDLAREWASRLDNSDLVGPGTKQPCDQDDSNPWAAQSLDWAAIVSSDGSWQWLCCRDTGDACGGTDDQDSISCDISDHLRSLARTCSESENQICSGMTRIGIHTLVTFAVVPIRALTDGAQDQTQGRYFVAGRRIDESMVKALRERTHVDFTLLSPRTSNPAQKLVIWEASESKLVVEVQLTGINDESLANVFIQVPREITARSRRTTTLARNSFIFGSVAALLMLLLLLQRIVIGPLTAIREYTDRVADQGLEAEPLVLKGNDDEISQLADAFDHTVKRLSDAQTQLTKASQAAGRSQVASAVIHNVGNVLTNVNSLLSAASGRVDSLRIGPLDKLASRLKDADSEEGLLDATPDYLEGLACSLKTDQEAISEMLATLDDNIRHVHDVIRDQHRHTDTAVEASRVKLKTIIEEAIACCQARLEQEAVTVEVTGPTSVNVLCDRSLLLQTMINVIGNARNALQDTEKDSRHLSIDVTPLKHSVRIEFRDNGCGMTEETMQRIFDAHFTTRETGSGLGLHFCAITLKRLNGSIHATSDGPGRGATFVIELPRRKLARAESSSDQNLPSDSMGAKNDG